GEVLVRGMPRAVRLERQSDHRRVLRDDRRQAAREVPGPAVVVAPEHDDVGIRGEHRTVPVGRDRGGARAAPGAAPHGVLRPFGSTACLIQWPCVCTWSARTNFPTTSRNSLKWNSRDTRTT